MAVKVDLVEKNLEDLEKEITCAICHEHYVEPKVLPCLHYYCKQCIQELASAGKGNCFSCPECRQEATLPDRGEEELKPAFIVNRLKSIHAKHKKALSKKVSCEICKNSQAIAVGFCQQCDKFACQGCVRQHSVMVAVFEGHHIFTLDELQVLNAEVLLPKSQPVKKCEVHDDPLKVFCFDCNKLICRDCTVKDHRDHNIEFNAVASKAKKAELLEILKPLSRVNDSLSDAMKELKHTEQKVKSQEDTLTDSIAAYFADLQKILTTRKQQLIEDVGDRVREKIQKLNEQEKSLSIATEGVCSVIGYTEQFVQHCTDSEIMSMHTEIIHQVNKLVKEHKDSENSLVPVESADLKVELDDESLQLLCRTKTEIVQGHAVIISKIPKVVKIGNRVRIKIRTHQIEEDVYSEVKNLVTGSVVMVCARPLYEREFTEDFTLSTCGRYEVDVSVDCDPVVGCPFSVFISNSPYNFMPLKEWGSVYKPISLAVNSVGEIVVAECDGNILVFDCDGNELRRILPAQNKIGSLNGAALDNCDNIFYIDGESAKIGKSDRSCAFITVHDTKSFRHRGRNCISVVGDEVMVLEHSNQGEILVFDKKLKYQRKIVGSAEANLKYFTSDCHGNLFVSSHRSVQVIHKNGAVTVLDFDFKRKLTPSWLHVSGPHLYVTNRSSQATIVFTTEGKHVATPPVCAGPMCTDKDGLLYIADFFSKAKKIYCYY